MYVGVLRRLMVCVGVCVLLYVCVRYRDPVQQSLQLLQQLRETQHGLQVALQRAGESAQRSSVRQLKLEPVSQQPLVEGKGTAACLSVCRASR